MLNDSSWQAEFSTTGGAAGLGTPPGDTVRAVSSSSKSFLISPTDYR